MQTEEAILAREQWENHIDQRLSFLRGKAKNLVPDPSEDVDPVMASALREEKREIDVRIEELSRLKKEMSEN
jgi:hypothetical protein